MRRPLGKCQSSNPSQNFPSKVICSILALPLRNKASKLHWLWWNAVKVSKYIGGNRGLLCSRGGSLFGAKEVQGIYFFLKATLKTEIPHGGKAVVCQREVLCCGQAGSTARGHAIWPLSGLELYSS